MDKMLFTNSNGESVEFSKDSAFKWTQVTDLGGLESVQQTTVSPFQDGTTPVGDSYFQSKFIKVDFVVLSNDVPVTIRQLNSIVNPKLGVGTLTVTYGTQVRQFPKVKTKTMPTLQGKDQKGLRYQVTSIVFEVFDPLFEAEEGGAVIRAGENLFEFPLNITDTFIFDRVFLGGYDLINEGDVPCPITIVMDGVLTAPITVTNTTTGEKIVVSLGLTSDEQLIITTQLDNINVVKRTISTGEDASAFQYIDIVETTFFYLQTGTNNITVTSQEGAVAKTEVFYKNRYVGL